MHYQGPEAADLGNVVALNSAWLNWLGATRSLQPADRGLPAAVQEKLASLQHAQRERLARAPFLLMSFREHDEARWQRLFAERRNLDLLQSLQACDDAAARIVAAGIGFIWQLAGRNPYAARLVSGASLNWCEQLAELTLVELFERIAGQGDLLMPRLADNANFWNKLLAAGMHPRRDVRAAARACALQTVLTVNTGVPYRRLRAAACRTPVPTMKVADRRRP